MTKEKTVTPNVPLSSDEKELLSLVDDHKDELIQLLVDLIAFDTRSYDVDTFSDLHPAVNYCKAFFTKYGISTQVLECPHKHDSSKTWPNLIASIKGATSGKKLGFMGHLDVVPFSAEQWADHQNPLEARINGNRLFGRGSADMKAGDAAQMMALVLLKHSGKQFNGELQIIFTPDEEIAGEYGAKFLAEQHHAIADADARIISEPTGQPPIKTPAIIIGEKGANWLRLTFHGASGHGSQPKPKSNAINKATRFIQRIPKDLKFKKVTPPMTKWDLIKGMLSRYRIKNLLGTLKSNSGETPSYDEDGSTLGAFFHTSISCNQIGAGKKINVIPDECTLDIDIRTLPGISNQDLLNDLANYCTTLGYRIHIPEPFTNPQSTNEKIQSRLIDIDLEIQSMNEGGAESKSSPLCQIMANSFENVFHTRHLFFFSPGMTDATHFRKEGISNIVVFGPSGDNAHDADEFIYIDDFINSTKCYLLTAYRYLNS